MWEASNRQENAECMSARAHSIISSWMDGSAQKKKKTRDLNEETSSEHLLRKNYESVENWTRDFKVKTTHLLSLHDLYDNHFNLLTEWDHDHRVLESEILLPLSLQFQSCGFRNLHGKRTWGGQMSSEKKNWDQMVGRGFSRASNPWTSPCQMVLKRKTCRMVSQWWKKWSIHVAFDLLFFH